MTVDDAPRDADPKIDGARLVAASQRGELTGALLPLMRAGRRKLADTLVSLHQSGSVDALVAFSSAALDEVTQHDFFLLMILFSEVLPRIDADPASLMRLTAHLVDRGGEDLAANTPNAAFRTWCTNCASRPKRVLAAVESTPGEHGRFTRFALEAGAVHDVARYAAEAMRLVAHTTPSIRLGAMSALSYLSLKEHPRIDDDVLAVLEQRIERATDEVEEANALGAVIERCLSAGERRTPALLRILEARPDVPPPLEQQVYAQALALHGAALSTAPLDALLRRLRRLDRRHGRIVEHLDAALSRYGDAFGVERVSDALTTLLNESVGAIGLDDFRSLEHRLRSGDANALRDRLLFDALHRGSVVASREIASIFTEVNERRTELSLDVGALGIPDEELVAVCRRATAILVLAPKATLDLLLEALDTVGKDAAAAIGELLFDPVGLNYPETVTRELKKRPKRRTSIGRKVVNAVVRRIDIYVSGIERACDLTELQPSALERRAVWEREMRTMQASQTRAQEHSVLAMLATPVHILYGSAVASYTPSADGEAPAVRQQSRFTSMSVSMERPRLDGLDPTEQLFAMQRFSED